MEQFKLLYIFATVLKYGSMSAAATHLGMTASAVSQHLRKLERHYGMQLLKRNTRSLYPTEAGKALWHYANQLLTLEQQLADTLTQLQDEPSGQVSLSLPTSYSQLVAMQKVFRMLRQKYPKIHLLLNEDNRFANFEQDGIDIAIRAVLTPEQPDLIVRTLAVWQTWLCASPDYLAQHPIHQPSDLLSAHWLNHSNSVLQQTCHSLNLPEQLPQYRTDCPNSSAADRTMAIAGLGVAILLEGDVKPAIERGELEVVLPHIPLPPRTIYAVTLHRSQSAKVRAVLEVLNACF